MSEIIRAEVAVSYGDQSGAPRMAVITHDIPVTTSAPGGSLYLTPEENEAALKAAAQAFAAALPTDRGYEIAGSLVSETKIAV
ncbi:hypothetical protein AB0I22_31880 [Streptomyces sp. NPDC050610]|uniref:hypothetical protein n=1 Tax=Streptomyces sp. NPDC050610 TaxID=3157097 RepID=UPI003418E655